MTMINIYSNRLKRKSPASIVVKSSNNPDGVDTNASRVIVITSGKGGVGKTTTAANLGTSIARLGFRVALIDSDVGLRNLDLLLGLENRMIYTATDVVEGRCRLDQAMVRDKRFRNLALLSRHVVEGLCYVVHFSSTLLTSVYPVWQTDGLFSTAMTK